MIQRLNLKPHTIILLLLSVTLIAISTAYLIKWFVDSNSASVLQEEVVAEAPVTEVADDDTTEVVNPPENPSSDYWDFIKLPLISVDFKSLLARNPETVAWIKIRSTNINYPVVQSSDNSFYLDHAFDGSKNSAGWIFADYRNNLKDLDQNTIIFGHSRRDSTMFGTLKSSLEQSWFENLDNHTIHLSTPTKNTLWQVFSVYKTTPDLDYLRTTFPNDKAFTEYTDAAISRSAHPFNLPVTPADKILTLSTCANNSTERLVLHARLIKHQAR